MLILIIILIIAIINRCNCIFFHIRLYVAMLGVLSTTETALVMITSAATGSKMVGGRGAAVAVPAHHVGPTLTLPAAGVTHRAEGALGVTPARWETECKEGK